jgi:hypothetical protein
VLGQLTALADAPLRADACAGVACYQVAHAPRPPRSDEAPAADVVAAARLTLTPIPDRTAVGGCGHQRTEFCLLMSA